MEHRMTKTTKMFQAIGAAIHTGVNARELSSAGVKYLHGNGPSPEWDLIPAERDLFAQYEPPTRTLTAKLQDVALYRYLVQRNHSVDQVLEVMA